MFHIPAANEYMVSRYTGLDDIKISVICSYTNVNPDIVQTCPSIRKIVCSHRIVFAAGSKFKLKFARTAADCRNVRKQMRVDKSLLTLA